MCGGPHAFEPLPNFPGSDSKACKCMTFSKNGQLFAYTDGVRYA